jgi:hypothetical protein
MDNTRTGAHAMTVTLSACPENLLHSYTTKNADETSAELSSMPAATIACR